MVTDKGFYILTIIIASQGSAVAQDNFPDALLTSYTHTDYWLLHLFLVGCLSGSRVFMWMNYVVGCISGFMVYHLCAWILYLAALVGPWCDIYVHEFCSWLP